MNTKSNALEICKAGLVLLTTLAMGPVALAEGPAGDASRDEVTLDNGMVRRVIDCRSGHVVTKSYALKATGDEFVGRRSSEFAFMANGRIYRGNDDWKDLSVRTVGQPDGGTNTVISLLSADGTLRVRLGYTVYPGLPLVRKTLSVANEGPADVRLELVDVEDLNLRLDCTNSRTYRQYGRFPAAGPYVGDWDDALVVIHDPKTARGLAVGNETVGVLKRTATFADGSVLQAGTTWPEQPYPFRRWLKPGQAWTSAAVFTAPYDRCADPKRVVETAVQAYVRRHMGTRVEQIAKKPTFVYNTWEPFFRKIDERLVRELAKSAADCGVEEFVIDDGWQVNVDPSGGYHGDWAVDPKKFPNGLKPVFDYIRSLGMKPGLWISLAYVSPSSKPYGEHPEWSVRDARGRTVSLHWPRARDRTQCMGTDWYGYIRDTILRLVREHGLAYAKLDLAVVTSAYVHDLSRSGCRATDHPGHRDREESFDVIYARCMDLFDELHREAPELFIDCTFETAGKLQLMDYGIARHAEGNWLSNIWGDGLLTMRTYAWERTPALPPASLVIGNLFMDGPDGLLAFKSLAGTLPIMLGDPRKLTSERRAEYKAWSGWLRDLEGRHGFMSFRQDIPGFGAPADGAWDGFLRINLDTQSGGLAGVFRQNAAEVRRTVTVPGLGPDVHYAVLRGVKGEKVAEMTGRELAERGFEVSFDRPVDGELFEIRRTEWRSDSTKTVERKW